MADISIVKVETRPIQADAVQFKPENVFQLAQWVGAQKVESSVNSVGLIDNVWFKMEEAQSIAVPNDSWVVKYADGTIEILDPDTMNSRFQAVNVGA